MRRELYGLGLLLTLPGCVSTAVAVVKAPFKVAGKTADWLTTSQAESDRNRGREARKNEDYDRRAERKAARQRADDERELQRERRRDD